MDKFRRSWATETTPIGMCTCSCKQDSGRVKNGRGRNSCFLFLLRWITNSQFTWGAARLSSFLPSLHPFNMHASVFLEQKQTLHLVGWRRWWCCTLKRKHAQGVGKHGDLRYWLTSHLWTGYLWQLKPATWYCISFAISRVCGLVYLLSVWRAKAGNINSGNHVLGVWDKVLYFWTDNLVLEAVYIIWIWSIMVMGIWCSQLVLLSMWN